MKDEFGDNEVDKTLGSLDKVIRAEAPGFLYMKVKARLLASGKGQPISAKLFSRFNMSLAAMLIVIMLNGFAISQLWLQKQSAISKEYAIKNFAQQYDLNVSTVYDNKTVDR